jgi:hypothetical protein
MGTILPYCCQLYGIETESFSAQSQSLAGIMKSDIVMPPHSRRYGIQTSLLYDLSFSQRYIRKGLSSGLKKCHARSMRQSAAYHLLSRWFFAGFILQP